MERDFEFMVPGAKRKKNARSAVIEDNVDDTEIAASKTPSIARMSPTHMTELLDIFIPPRLDFYRPLIVEPKAPEKAEMTHFGGAAGELLSARLEAARLAGESKPQAIYGSVSTQDVLVAMRSVLAGNDDAARVVLQESDIAFVDLPELEGSEAGRVKHTGDYKVEIWIKGASKAVMRTIRVIPQEGKSATGEESAQ